jgi:phage gp16-like protein
MIYPLDELIDRISILKLKIERIPNEKSELIKEYEDYTEAIKKYVIKGICTNKGVEQWYKQLYEINKTIWDLEADIRKGKEGELGLEEVGRRAIKIRENNGKRVRIKSLIVEKTGSGYKDIKINHASS